MKLLDFFKQFQLLNGATNNKSAPVFYFFAKMYSPLFAYQLYCFFKRTLINRDITVIIPDKSPSYYHGQLQVSFLGNNIYYWIPNFTHLSKTLREEWRNYLVTYKGPHIIFCYDININSKYISKYINSVNFIEVSEYISIENYTNLYKFLYPENIINKSFVTEAFSYRQYFTLDNACLLMSYQSILGRNSIEFFKRWFKNIITHEKSLFILSQYFFAQDASSFFKYWAQYSNDYPQEFWMTFFSEQLWQAALFIKRVQAYGHKEAKKHTYRVPFSFINKDWKRFNFQTLQKAHHELYILDYMQKNTTITYGLDLWCHNFLYH